MFGLFPALSLGIGRYVVFVLTAGAGLIARSWALRPRDVRRREAAAFQRTSCSALFF